MSDAKTIPSGGTVAPGFEAVRDAFIEAQAKDRGGAQLCVYRHGRQVVDLWAGHDPENDRPYGEDTIGVLMTGIGDDGADQMVAIKQAGGHTIAESEQTAVVYGMPREAVERGGACVVAPSHEVAGEIVKAVRRTME